MKWDVEKLRKAGIEHSLSNYLLFTRGTGCRDCIYQVKCMGIGLLSDDDELPILLKRCPILVIDAPESSEMDK